MPVLRGDGKTWDYSPTELARERACRWKRCVCTHTECFDGWLDRPEDEGKPAMRCPTCEEGREMTQELEAEEQAARRSRRRR